MAKFKKQPIKIPLQKQLFFKQDFIYSKGDTNLNFTLKLTQKNLEDFKEILIEALKDVQASLDNIA